MNMSLCLSICLCVCEWCWILYSRLIKAPSEAGLELGYATVGPRGSRSTPMKFSTLQRPRPSSSSSTPVTASHAISPLDLQGAPSHRQATHEYANTHYATAAAHAPDAHYASTLTRDGQSGNKMTRRPSYDQAPHAHAGQEDSGSSGYGGSPRQETGPGKGPHAATTPVTSPGTGGLPRPSTDAPAQANGSASTLRRQRSLLDADKKAAADAAQAPPVVNGGGGGKYS